MCGCFRGNKLGHVFHSNTMKELIVIRHGQSEFNAKKIFTGWMDPGLTEKGIAEAKQAGVTLKALGYTFDVAYTSYLTRSIKTLHLALEEMDMLWLPIMKDWRINERCYGALQGFTHAEKIEEVGEDQVFIWRRSFDTPPPALDESDPRHPKNDPRYANVDAALLPATESLKDTIERFQPCLEGILDEVKNGKKIVLSAHGNTIRALVMHLDGISPEEIRGVNIPTGVPMRYTFDDEMNVLGREYLEA